MAVLERRITHLPRSTSNSGEAEIEARARRRMEERQKTKHVEIIGYAVVDVPIIDRVWVTRKDEIRQRYWKKTGLFTKALMQARYRIYGRGDTIYKVIIHNKRTNLAPKYVITKVSAKEYLSNPSKYGEGTWDDKTKVVSRRFG